MSNQNHKKRTFRIAIFFIILAIVLPVSGYYLGSRGFLMPENEIGKTNLKPVASGLTVEYDYSPAPVITSAPSATPEAIGGTTIPTPAVATTPAPGNHEVASVNTSTLRVRSGPSQDHSQLDTLTQGTTVTVLEMLPNGWWKIQTSTIIGYVDSTYLTVRTDY
jgi:hypothetical protein